MKYGRILQFVLFVLLFGSTQAQVNDTVVRYINTSPANFHSFDAVLVTGQQMSALNLYESGSKANADQRFDEAIVTL